MSTSRRQREISVQLPLIVAPGFCQPWHSFIIAAKAAESLGRMLEVDKSKPSIPSNPFKDTEGRPATSSTERRENSDKIYYEISYIFWILPSLLTHAITTENYCFWDLSVLQSSNNQPTEARGVTIYWHDGKPRKENLIYTNGWQIKTRNIKAVPSGTVPKSPIGSKIVTVNSMEWFTSFLSSWTPIIDLVLGWSLCFKLS